MKKFKRSVAERYHGIVQKFKKVHPIYHTHTHTFIRRCSIADGRQQAF